FNSTDITTFPTNDLALYFITFQVENRNGIFNSLFRGSTLYGLNNDFAGFFIGLLFCIVNYFLLNTDSLCLSFIPQAFYQLAFGFIRSKTRNFLKTTNMFFLMLF